MILKVEDKNIKDEFGRTRIFNGINIVNKGKKDEMAIDGISYEYGLTKSHFEILKDNGINIIRLGIIWHAIEREIGIYNTEYLNWVRSILDLCHEFEISAFLDMHQDLYSCQFGDGAPTWATLTDGSPHTTGELWSDAYLFSDAVNNAYKNFWDNKKTEDGIGILEHYEKTWKYIIKLFGNHPAVIGYDFINEPFPGENSLEIMGSLLMAYCSYTGKNKTPQEAMELLNNEELKVKLLQDIDDTELYAKMAVEGKDLVAKFDEGKLADFYIRMTKTLRSISQVGLVFTENCYFSNMGIESSLKRIEVNGEKEQLQVYAPHGYDLVVDTPLVNMSSNNRMAVILNGHKKVQDRLNMPVLFGEWGAHYKHTEALEHLEFIINYFDKNKWSHTYWCWFDGYEGYTSANILKRPYPMCVAGEIVNYGYDFKAKIFNLKWEANKNIKEPTLIYVEKEPKDIKYNGQYKLIKNGINSYVIEIKNAMATETITITL
ncbi:MAG: cellulase family glycosylhydrolase [Lachnospirales bacterium]